MAIGIDDDFIDDEFIEDDLGHQEEPQEQQDDIITELLREKGIQDASKIKFEGEDGEIEEQDWNQLSIEDQLNILRSSDSQVSNNSLDLDDSELQLINAIRSSRMSPTEYFQNVQRQGVNNYIQQNSTPQYQIDNIDDETLFITDIIARVGDENITDEELEHLLENAKQNEDLFRKQVNAIRQEYKNREDENRNQVAEYQKQQQVEKYNIFAEKIENEIRGFTEIGGFDLNMDESEMEEVYDFLTGFDQAGVSFFSKALNDPKLLVRMAWFALNGDKAMQDINDYWTNEVKKSRNQKKTSQVEIKKNNNKFNNNSSVDDDF